MRCAMKNISSQLAACIERRRPAAAHDRQDHAPVSFGALCREITFDVRQTDRFSVSFKKT
jgi:hypothetical protein